eukprot:CAMPEP_0167752104 /NCGR_PEP_ID=MMETSP0110_2-20121227/6945_1 /TAXON_ID=629695 /ORGANISM="Gymnochlora sp., Strain CCMP2014" /LENGTH=158 /DNA_ID=CAMNT_0007637667 /DNA_START=32 /DNA_END=508 /DNA_ORIENTATION=-
MSSRMRSPVLFIAMAAALFAIFALKSSQPSLKMSPAKISTTRLRSIPQFSRQAYPRSVIARNEGLEQIPEPERPDTVTGYTARDSAGQSNIFGRETKAYVGETVSRSGLLTGGYILAAMAAGGALILPNIKPQEDFSEAKYEKMSLLSKKFADELGMN